MNKERPKIFLDIDGVLNDIGWFLSRRELLVWETLEKEFRNDSLVRDLYDLNPVSVGLLSLLIKRTNAQVVISSSWRNMHSLEEMKRFFELICPSFPVEAVIDITPRLIREEGKVRGDEIAAWMDENSFFGRYVILDDDSDMLPGQTHIKTNIRGGGLTQEVFLKAEAILLGDNE